MSDTRETEWRPPRPTDLGGPDQLAEVMVDFRHWHASKGLHANGEISDAQLARLIQLAYFASQSPDEGRFPQFRVFTPAAGARSTLEELRILRFTEPQVLRDVNSVRRLAPSVASHDRALLVLETGHGLLCDGIVSVHRAPALGPPQQAHWSRPEGLMIRVDGPGALQVTEAGLTFVLRAGHVRNLTPFQLIDPVKTWFTELADTLVARCAATDPQHFVGHHLSLRMLLSSLWADVLQSAQNLRHGGAFIIVPQPAAAPLTRRTEVSNLHLGWEIEAYWRSRLAVERPAAAGGPERALQTCQRHWERLLTRAKAVAYLSAVDGCVVLDRELRLDSFGAVIQVDGAQLLQANAPDLDYWTHEPLTISNSHGTRHQSARNLCRVVPGAFAFVISQDGEFTLFFSDTRGVFRAGPLSLSEGSDW